MPRKAIKKQIITIPQAKKILESIGEEQLDQFQRRSLDYTSKFSKLDSKTAEKLITGLVEKFELEEEEVIQLVNCMPESVEEVRVFLAGGRRIVEISKLEEILAFLDEHRKKE
jgi:DNA-directed RNA polymerase subunit F